MSIINNKPKTVRSVFDKAVSEVKQIQEANAAEMRKQEKIILEAERKHEAAASEVGLAKNVVRNLANVFGIDVEEAQDTAAE